MKNSRIKLKTRDLIMFFERLELYVSAGLSLDTALRIMTKGNNDQYQLSPYERIRLDINKGYSLYKSVSTHIRISKTTEGLIEHGESSGQLQKSFVTARHLLEREDELKKTCLSALAYPVIIGLFAVLLTIGLVRGVMPQIIPMLKGLRVELPLLTRIVIYISDHLVSSGSYILVGIILAAVLHIFLFRKYTGYKKSIQSILLRLPFVGTLLYAYSLSLFLQSCGSLVESGISVATAYANTTKAITLIPLAKFLEGFVPDINRGVQLGTILENKSKRIPGYVSSLLIAGEASGSLGTSLLRAAQIIDRDIGHSLKRLTSLIEPVMMAGIGCIVGGIALSILMPIYDISKVLQHA
jgi:type II secretory pathway component PulF